MSDGAPGLADRLAMDRTGMAIDRTLMAWVRTALSMISFGFAIHKTLQLLQEQSAAQVMRPQAPRVVGLTFIGIGIFSLLVATVQALAEMKKLRPGRPVAPWNLSVVVAVLVGSFGILLFLSILFGSGPFA